MEFIVVLKRDIKNLICSPVLLIYNTLFPILIILILGYLTSGNYNGKTFSSYDYYGVSMMVFGVAFVAMTASNSFMEERVKSSNLRIMYSPINIASIYMSKIVATFIFSSICDLIIMLFLSLVFNVNYGGSFTVYVLVLLGSFDFFSCTVGVLFCCIFKSENLANKVLSPFINIFIIIGGVFFPVESLGKTMTQISNFSPVKWLNEAVFKIIYDKDLSYFMPAVIIIVLLTIVCLVLCKLTFKEEDYV